MTVRGSVFVCVSSERVCVFYRLLFHYSNWKYLRNYISVKTVDAGEALAIPRVIQSLIWMWTCMKTKKYIFYNEHSNEMNAGRFVREQSKQLKVNHSIVPF